MKPVNLYNWIGSAAVVLLFSMTSSCTDEDIQRSYTATDGIAFTPSIETRSWSTGDGTTTRTTVPVTRHSVMKLNNAQGGRDLYLHTTETDSIAAPLANDTAHIATRGAVVTTDNFGDVYEGFGVLAYAYQGEWDGTLSPNYIDNEQATKTGETYGFNPVHVWPGNAYQMAFFAYAPYDETGKIFNEKTGAPTLAYTVPTDITEQNDLLAYWQTGISGDKREAQQLKFSHLCTAVKFKVGDGLENAVTSISIQNVYGSGTYSVDGEKWTATGEANGTYTFAIEEEETPDGAELTNGESVFMMIPQELPEDAMIEVKYKSEGGQEKEYTASIGGKEWQKGHTVVYTLSKTEIIETAHFTVEAAVSEIDHSGGTLTYKVTSYTETSVDGAVTTTPTAWKITGYQENGSSDWSTDAPDWITVFSASGNGTEEQTAKIAAQEYYVTNPHNDALKSAYSVNGTYDLSTQGDTEPMNTANCYVINAPGKYSLPLVYGNAIKDGQPNTSAYESSAAPAEYILKNLVNHAGNPITNPYIYNNEGCDPDNATLVWQDSPDLVTNVKLSEDKENMTFEVSQDNIAQGNAVIAVRNSNDEILWSWHIWVTDYVPGGEADKDAPMKDKVVTNNQNNKYTFMAVYLGYCGNTGEYYEGRSVKVRFEQEKTGKKYIIEFTQTQHFDSYDTWNVPYYQWGRKEPMLPAQGHNQQSLNKMWYDAAGEPSKAWANSYVKNVKEIKKAIPSWIKNPGKMIGVSVSSSVYLYRNLWNASPDDKSVVKTVYDPSPVGYHIPPRNAFNGFTYNGKNYGNDSWAQFNSPFDSDRDLYDNHYTWVFYCNRMKGEGVHDDAGGTISFPCADQRMVANSPSGDSRGYTWTASCVFEKTFAHSAYCMQFGNSVRVSETYRFLYGFPVRPVRETE
ncbi:fimbrillin family protein [Phocaeicola plebeius]|uniref:fimbrillin family protein n=1 Tax=Phocaeicola plebeius TaxID=310297 RepID=UPI0026EB027A|nr:fimbrillin family protein [Phocaeicola plebeius]